MRPAPATLGDYATQLLHAHHVQVAAAYWNLLEHPTPRPWMALLHTPADGGRISVVETHDAAAYERLCAATAASWGGCRRLELRRDGAWVVQRGAA